LKPIPLKRPRRLRAGEAIRSMVRETHLRPEDLISPMFVVNGKDRVEPIDSMPGVFRLSVENAVTEAGEVFNLGIPAVLLFGIPESKDAVGSSAGDEGESVQKAVKAIKDRYPDLLVITDICLCEYTDHGHCGVVENGKIINDATLDLLAGVALSHVRAGGRHGCPFRYDGRAGGSYPQRS
jgi:porphobilinogen synthase